MRVTTEGGGWFSLRGAVLMKQLLATATLVCALHTAGAGLASAQQDFQYLGEVRLFAGSYCPMHWAPAAGQLLRIGENPQLFQLLGTHYGGDGLRTFALPDLTGQPPKAPEPVGETQQGLIWCIATYGYYPQMPEQGNPR
jgi:hypothetical protein